MNLYQHINIGISYTVSYILLLALVSSGAVFLPFESQQSLSLLKVVEGAALVFLMATLLPSRISRPSSVYLHLQFLLINIPMTVLHVYLEYSTIFYYYSILGFLVMFAVCRYIRVPFFPWVIEAQRMRSLFVVIALLMLFTASLSMFGLGNYFNLDIWLVYDYRRDAAGSLPWGYAYLLPWFTKVLTPLALILSLQSRRPVLVVLIIFINTIIFGLTSNKLTLFTPFFVIGAYFLFHRCLTGLQMATAYCVAGITLIGAYSAGAVGFVSLAARRALFVPSHLNYIYYDYFGGHGFMLWGQGVAGSELRNGSRLIGEDFFGKEGMNANTGWIGSGYMNAGYFGVILYAMLMGLVLRVLDNLSTRRRLGLVVSLSLLPMIAMITSADLPTGMLTHGGGIVILLLHIKWFDRVTSGPTTMPNTA